MTKIISLSEKKKEIEEQELEASRKLEVESDPAFEETMKKNEEKKQKLAKERAAANKSVLRTYRLKP